MQSSSFNTFNSSHASFSLFHLPTHNSTYNLAATTRDLSTNLGFKILALEEEEYLKQIIKLLSFARFHHKINLEIVGARYLEASMAALLFGRDGNGEEKWRGRGRHKEKRKKE